MSRIKKQSINEMPGLKFIKGMDLTDAIRKIIKEGIKYDLDAFLKAITKKKKG